jgi:hypothetical protein
MIAALSSASEQPTVGEKNVLSSEGMKKKKDKKKGRTLYEGNSRR